MPENVGPPENVSRQFSFFDYFTRDPKPLLGRPVPSAVAGAFPLDASPGSYNISGVQPALLVGYQLNANSGSYAIGGTQATILTGHQLNVNSGSYVIGGVQPTILHNYQLNASPGAYNIGGVAADFAVTTIQAKPSRGLFTRQEFQESYSLILQGLLLQEPPGIFHLDVLPGSYTISGQSADIVGRQQQFSRRFGIVEYGIRDLQPVIRRPLSGITAYSLDASPGNYAINGQPADIARPLPPGKRVFARQQEVKETYLYNVQGLVTLSGARLDAAPGNYSITGQSADIIQTGLPAEGKNRRFSLVEYGIRDNRPVIRGRFVPPSITAYSLDANPGIYNITGVQPAILEGYQLNSLLGNYTINGIPADIVYSIPVQPRRSALIVRQQQPQEIVRPRLRWSQPANVLPPLGRLIRPRFEPQAQAQIQRPWLRYPIPPNLLFAVGNLCTGEILLGDIITGETNFDIGTGEILRGDIITAEIPINCD